MTWTLYGLELGATILEILLNEAGADLAVKPISIARDQQPSPTYAAITPMRRLPFPVSPDGGLVCKSLAGMLVLAEHLPDARLLPPAATSARATAFRWRAFLTGELYGAVGRFDCPEHTQPT